MLIRSYLLKPKYKGILVTLTLLGNFVNDIKLGSTFSIVCTLVTH